MPARAALWTLFLVLVFSHAYGIELGGNHPSPKCNTGFFYQTLPLTENEASIINLDHLFDGYNLEYSLQEAEDFEKYITLGDKLTQQGREIPDLPLIGLKNYHIQKRGNAWGSSFVALTERSERTFVHYGVVNSNRSAPVVNNYVSVENNTNTTCYDAVVFAARDLILVDCVVQLKAPNRKGQLLENLFYYFRLSDGSFLRNLRTEMYVDFEKPMARRGLHLYSDLFSQHSFLLRTYFSDGVESSELRQNTYVEVFMLTDPEDPWVVEVIDRAFLGARTLEVADVRIYQGEIFVLDRGLGVYRVYINTEEDLRLRAFHEARGFERLAVFSNNLDGNLELALANAHSVHELDWSRAEEPLLLNKYSLMPGSAVSQLFLNERFVFVQAASHDVLTYNYTWILNRGDRTYSKAFKVIRHDTAQTLIDVNEDESYLIVIDDQQLLNYALDDSNMRLQLPRDEDLFDTLSSFRVIATSKDPMDSQTAVKCEILLNFTLLEFNNRTMWPIGDAPPTRYTANFPGKVVIKLHEYVLGPNVTYRIKEIDHDVIKDQKVYMQEQLTIKWGQDGAPHPPFITNDSQIDFLHTETFNDFSKDNDRLIIYLQDSSTNATYFVYCTPNHRKTEVHCSETEEHDFGGQINNWATGAFLNDYSLKRNHVVAYSTTKHYNRIILIENSKRKQGQTLTEEIQLEKSFAGNATSIAISNKELYVVLKYVKTVEIYDLELCVEGVCEPKCKLDHMKMYNLGIRFFSPVEVHTSVHHESLVFIKTSVEIIVVDYSRECVPKLLARVTPVETSETEFVFKVNLEHLLITIPSQNRITEYDIRRLDLGEVTLTKSYPQYGYKVPKVYDMDVSDLGQCIYATMVNEGGDYQVFVYRSGYPAVGTLYDVIDLFSYEAVLVDATGFDIDYVTVYGNRELRIFRQYEEPLAEVFNPNVSYSFYLEYFNPATRSNLEQIEVEIVNLPTYIEVNPFLDDIMNTKDLLFSGEAVVNEIDDSDWWKGNVLRIEPDCRDCRGEEASIRVNNHIQEEYTEKIVPRMSEFQWSFRGGSIQAANSILDMQHNGTVQQFIKLPYQDSEFCETLAVGYKAEYEVSGCLTEDAINLYLTSFVSEKGFAFEPEETPARHLFKLDAVNDLIILVDVESDPYEKVSEGGIYFYGINFDDEVPSGLVQIEYFDGEDLGMDELGQIFINNAELTYHQETDTYRLYFTEMTRGIFIIDFKYASGNTHLTVRTISRLPVVDMLTPLNYQLPYDATFQAVGMLESAYDPTLKKTTEAVLLTTGKFHTIEIKIDFDLNGNIMRNFISRLYMRYAFYDIQNYIKHHNGLFVISQVLPTDFDIENRSKQLLTIYSTRDQRHPKVDDDQNATVEQRGFLGAFRINDTDLRRFDFNLTYNEGDGHSEPRMGMVLIEDFSDTLQKFSVHQNLSVVTKQTVDTQIIYIDLRNDFSLQKIRILMNGFSPYPEWKLILIILCSIIGFIILSVVCIFVVKKVRERRGSFGGEDFENREYQDSLISGGSNDRKSLAEESRNSVVVEEKSAYSSSRYENQARNRQTSPTNEESRRSKGNAARRVREDRDEDEEDSQRYEGQRGYERGSRAREPEYSVGRSRTRNYNQNNTMSNDDYNSASRDNYYSSGNRSSRYQTNENQQEAAEQETSNYGSGYSGYSRYGARSSQTGRNNGRNEGNNGANTSSRGPRTYRGVQIIED